MNDFAFELGRSLTKEAGILDVIKEMAERIPRALSYETAPAVPLEEKFIPEYFSTGAGVRTRDLPLFGLIMGGAGGAGLGGAGGAGLGALWHYMRAQENRRRLMDYMKSMLIGGFAGAGIGGLGGAALGTRTGERAQGYRTGEFAFHE